MKKIFSIIVLLSILIYPYFFAINVNANKIRSDDISYWIIWSKYEKYFDDLYHNIRNEKNYSTRSSKIYSWIWDLEISVLEWLSANLNEKEIKIYKENRKKALLCIANWFFAVKYSWDLYDWSWVLWWNQDAFRHAIWNFWMSRDVWIDFAKKWADAHEEWEKRQHHLYMLMDLYNNQLWRNLFKKYPDTIWHSDFKNRTLEAIRNWEWKILVNSNLVRSNSNGEK